LVADYYIILARWTNCFYQLLNVNAFNDVRQTKLHRADSLVSESSSFEFDLAIEKQKVTNHHVLIKSQQNC
jgi:hypothetical protein